MKPIIFFLLIMLVPGFAVGEPPKGMVLVPAGEFVMGTDDTQAPADQRPARKIHVDAFYIDKHEVTNAQFEEFILADGYNKRKYWTEAGWAFIQKERFFYIYPGKETYRIEGPLGFGENSVSTAPDHPVIGVSWYEAAAYAKWAGKRLPTEAEWEKTARGTNARTYPWGNAFDFAKLNYFPHHEKLSPVGSFPEGASPYGVMDMAGSVAEWCADDASGDEIKAIRGGGWNAIRLQLRCTHRETQPPTYRHYTVGFRCTKSAN
ncbi:MAG: SUMF1/EgtB/PvdO family nonheme iron enzyme [Candidatus Poribacteria bacterium]|nr:SUMF1/EgtB/PvdO family nonheme iron enzyme [Candidatus Poribacteria bacterium]